MDILPIVHENAHLLSPAVWHKISQDPGAKQIILGCQIMENILHTQHAEASCRVRDQFQVSVLFKDQQ
jgi:hypothetical protein